MSIPKNYTNSFGKTYIIAPFLRRLAAFVIDSLFITFLSLFVVNILDIIFRKEYEPVINIITGEFSMFFIIGLPYHLVAEQSSWQGSIGKRILGIKVVDKDADKPSFWQSLLRNLFKFAIIVLVPVVIWKFLHVYPPLVFIFWVVILVMAASDKYNRFLSDFPTQSFVLLRKK